MFKDSKSFTMKGNVGDLAVCIIIGAASGKIISTFVTDALMPPTRLLMGGIDFRHFTIVPKQTVGNQPVGTANYLNFIKLMLLLIL